MTVEGDEHDRLPKNITRRIDDVITYLQARIIGHGKVTREECLAYHEGQDGAGEDPKP